MPLIVSAALLAALLYSGEAALGGSAADCTAADGMEFRCGFSAPEDMVPVAGTSWLIASSLSRDTGRADLQLVDTASTAQHPVRVAATPGDEAEHQYMCPGGFSGRNFRPHGIALRAGAEQRHRLFVVNHAAMDRIEIFEVNIRPDIPSLRWIGCIAGPKGAYLNSVAALPDGGVLTTSQFNERDRSWPERRARLLKGEQSGGLFLWRPGGAFEPVKTPPMSGPNGLEISGDGRYAFVTGWSERRIYRIDLNAHNRPRSLKVSFLPDNLRWSDKRMLLVAGQGGNAEQAFACHLGTIKPKYCEPKWTVLALDPRTLRTCHIWSGNAARAAFGDVSTALVVNKSLWLGSISGDRVAIIPSSGSGECTGR